MLWQVTPTVLPGLEFEARMTASSGIVRRAFPLRFYPGVQENRPKLLMRAVTLKSRSSRLGELLNAYKTCWDLVHVWQYPDKSDNIAVCGATLTNLTTVCGATLTNLATLQCVALP